MNFGLASTDHESTGKKVGVYYPEAGLRYSGSGKELGDGSVFVKKNGETKTVACAKCPHCSLYFYLTEKEKKPSLIFKKHLKDEHGVEFQAP